MLEMFLLLTLVVNSFGVAELIKINKKLKEAKK